MVAVIEDHVAQGNPECRVESDEFFHHIVGYPIHFLLCARLRVAETNHLEGAGFFLAVERKVDGAWEWTSRSYPFEFEAAVGRTVGLVNVVEAGDAVFVAHSTPATWFDNEDDRVAAQRNRVTPVAARPNDLAAIRHSDAAQPVLIRTARAVAVGVVIDKTRGDFLGNGIDEARKGEKGSREKGCSGAGN